MGNHPIDINYQWIDLHSLDRFRNLTGPSW